MTRDQEPFIRAILENPDDEAPLLIFGDWLEENGEFERAEHLRLRCELTRSVSERPAGDAVGLEQFRIEAERRLTELDRRYESSWLAELPRVDGLHWHAIEDGLVRSVNLYVRSAKQADAILDVLFRTMPVRHLEFWELSDDAAKRFAACPDLKYTDYVDFRGPRLPGSAARILMNSPHWERLRIVEGNGGQWSAIEDLDRLPKLDTLIMHRGGDRIVDRPLLGRLKTLILNLTDLGPDWPSEFTNSPYLRNNLEVLRLESCSLFTSGFETIARSERLSSLQRLTLSNCSLGQSRDDPDPSPNRRHSNGQRSPLQEGVFPYPLTAIPRGAGFPGLRNLVSLTLADNHWLGDDGCAWLGSCPDLANLQVLDLCRCGFEFSPLSLANAPTACLRPELHLIVNRHGMSDDDIALLRSYYPNTHIVP